MCDKLQNNFFAPLSLLRWAICWCIFFFHSSHFYVAIFNPCTSSTPFIPFLFLCFRCVYSIFGPTFKGSTYRSTRIQCLSYYTINHCSIYDNSHFLHYLSLSLSLSNILSIFQSHSLHRVQTHSNCDCQGPNESHKIEQHQPEQQQQQKRAGNMFTDRFPCILLN